MSKQWETKKEYEQGLREWFTYFYLRTDGTYEFPNSAEGDMLRMTWKMLNLPEEETK